MKIKTQLVLGILVIVIAAVSGITYVLVKDAEQILVDEINARGKMITNYLKGVSAEPLLKKDEVTLASYLQEVSGTPGVEYALITDSRDRIAASNNLKDIGKDIDKLYKSQHKDNGIIHVRYNNKDMTVVNFAEKIGAKTGGKFVVYGKVFFGINQDYIDGKLLGIYIKSGVIAAGVIVISVLFSLFLELS